MTSVLPFYLLAMELTYRTIIFNPLTALALILWVNRCRNSAESVRTATCHVDETRRRHFTPPTLHHVISVGYTTQHALSPKSKKEIQIIQRARDSARTSSSALLSLGRIEQEKEFGRLSRKSPAGSGLRVDSTPADARDERTLCHHLYMDTSQVLRPCLGPS